MTEGMAQLVELLPSIWEVPGSIPRNTHTQTHTTDPDHRKLLDDIIGYRKIEVKNKNRSPVNCSKLLQGKGTVGYRGST
jgi:hypothetical protein